MMEDQMLTRLALVLSLFFAAGAADAAIPRHEATGLIGERTEAAIEKNQISPVPAPVVVEDIALRTGTDVQS
jgi:hypothetical protein